MLWTAPPPGKPPDAAPAHRGKIDSNPAGELDAVDLFGRKAPVKRVGQTHVLTATGAPIYVAGPRNATLAVRSTGPTSGAARQVHDLNLFDDQADWTFSRTTGDGSFRLATTDDGRSIAELHYDFMESTSKTRPYVLAATPVNIPEGASGFRLHVRSDISPRTSACAFATRPARRFRIRTCSAARGGGK